MRVIPNHFLIFYIFLFASTTIISCEQIGDLREKQEASIDTEFYEMDFSLSSSTRLNLQIFMEDIITNDFDKLCNSAGINNDKVKSVVVKEAVVNLLDAQSIADFDILKFIELTIYTDSLGETKIAESNPMPAGQSTISLDIISKNLLPYFEADNFILTSQGFLKERIYEEVKLHAKIKFQIVGEL